MHDPYKGIPQLATVVTSVAASIMAARAVAGLPIITPGFSPVIRIIVAGSAFICVSDKASGFDENRLETTKLQYVAARIVAVVASAVAFVALNIPSCNPIVNVKAGVAMGCGMVVFMWLVTQSEIFRLLCGIGAHLLMAAGFALAGIVVLHPYFGIITSGAIGGVISILCSVAVHISIKSYVDAHVMAVRAAVGGLINMNAQMDQVQQLFDGLLPLQQRVHDLLRQNQNQNRVVPLEPPLEPPRFPRSHEGG
jgi:hypothetical protein